MCTSDARPSTMWLWQYATVTPNQHGPLIKIKVMVSLLLPRRLAIHQADTRMLQVLRRRALRGCCSRQTPRQLRQRSGT